MPKRFRLLVNHIRKNLPCAFPVYVRRKPIKDWGGAIRIGKKFNIVLSPLLTEPALSLIFLHEYAHCLAWNHLDDVSSSEELDKRAHDEIWGVAYSRVYQVYEKFICS